MKTLPQWRIRAFKSLAWIFGAWLISVAISLILEKPVCSVTVVDPITHWREDGPTPECSDVSRDVRSLGVGKYANISGRTYWMKDDEVRDFSSCLIGFGCFLSVVREHISVRNVTLINLGGAIDFGKLKAYLGGEYVSDGYTVINGWQTLPLLDPPINAGMLRRIIDSKNEGSQYVTDGTWVLFNGRHVIGANLPTFQVFPQLDKAPKDSAKLARDINAVYYESEPISDADPATFELAVLPSEDTLEGYYGLDRANVWDLSGMPYRIAPEVAGKVRRRINWLKRESSK